MKWRCYEVQTPFFPVLVRPGTYVHVASCESRVTENPTVDESTTYESINVVTDCTNIASCSHKMCGQCYDLYPNGTIFKHCDGSVVSAVDYADNILWDLQNGGAQG